MEFPELSQLPAARQRVDVFRGYCRQDQAPLGQWQQMENLTSDHFPALAPRGGRVCLEGASQVRGILAKDQLCYVDGPHFVMGQYPVDLGLTDSPKTLVSMGAYVIILPDRKWINTLDLTEFGNIDAQVRAQNVRLSLCSLEGTPYEDFPLGDTPPEPENGTLWMDTSQRPHVLKRYSSASETWTAVTGTYVKLFAPGLGAAFSRYDGVTLSGLTEESLNGAHVIWDRGEDWLLIPGLLDAPLDGQGVHIQRRMPELDFCIESGNRLWGCRYGVNAQGQVVNEIYASRLGDFKNWNCYLGLATDSFAVSCGTDGPFTGAVSYLGYPLFFKEQYLHKVYGSYPASFQLQTTALRGVERGSEKSLCQLGEVLYYKSPSGVCAYDGSLPQVISRDLGRGRFTQAVAGASQDKLYLSMLEDGEPWLFVFDPGRGLWHREDRFPCQGFCFCRGQLYALSEGKLWSLLGHSPEEVPWMAVTGELGLGDQEARYLTRLTLNLRLEPSARLRVLVQYDENGHWESLAYLRGREKGCFSLPLPVRRCQRLQLKLEGKGDFRLYSLTQTLTEGAAL